MARLARFIIDDGTYHILLRGNNRRTIFNNADDYLHFLKLLSDIKIRYGFTIYHYCLMSNHVHLIVHIASGKNLSLGMKSLCVKYVNYYRKKYGGVGHFFQDRFKSYLIGDENYMMCCARYVENNPVTAGMVKAPEKYQWSSASYYLMGHVNKTITPDPAWVNLATGLAQKRRAYADFLSEKINDRRRQERYFKIGFFGSENQLKELQNQGLKSKWSHSGPRKKKP